MRNKLFFLILSLFLIPSLVSAREVLTLDNFVKTAVKKNPHYQISAQEYLIALEQNKSAKSIEDWNLIASAFWNEMTPAAINILSARYQRNTGYSLGLEKYFSQTGTALKLEHSNTKINSQYPPPVTVPGLGTFDFNPPAEYYISDLSLTITQPLLKNAFGLASKNALKISDFSLELARIKLAEDWEDFITMLREEYFLWQKRHINVSLLRNKVKKVEDQLKLISSELIYGLSEDLDLVQIKQKVQAYKILLQQEYMAYAAQTRKILLLIGNSDVTAAQIMPQGPIELHEALDESAAFSYLVTDSNISKTTNIAISIQKTNLETKENEKHLDLNLVLQAKPNAFSEGFSESYGELGEYYDRTISLSASRPLFNQQADAAADQARIEYEKAIKQREDALLNARIALSSLYSNFKYINNLINLNKTNLDLAKERLALEKKKFNQGRSSVYFILQAEDNLLLAEDSYNKALFGREEIINQINSLTDRYAIEYKDLFETKNL